MRIKFGKPWGEVNARHENRVLFQSVFALTNEKRFGWPRWTELATISQGKDKRIGISGSPVFFEVFDPIDKEFRKCQTLAEARPVLRRILAGVKCSLTQIEEGA